MEENKITEYKNKNFVISEILACVSFILNTICVITAKDSSGPGSSAWNPDFGLLYWSKTIFAFAGIFYFLKQGLFGKKVARGYLIISTLIVLLYSIPIMNLSFIIITAMLLKLIGIVSLPLKYQDRIPIQIFWSMPVFIIILDLRIILIKFLNNKDNK